MIHFPAERTGDVVNVRVTFGFKSYFCRSYHDAFRTSKSASTGGVRYRFHAIQPSRQTLKSQTVKIKYRTPRTLSVTGSGGTPIKKDIAPQMDAVTATATTPEARADPRKLLSRGQKR